MSLGLMYEDGRVIPRDFARAMVLYQQSAAQNHEPAIRILENLKTYTLPLPTPKG